MLGFLLVVTIKNLLFCSAEMKLRVTCILGKCSTTVLYPEPCDLGVQSFDSELSLWEIYTSDRFIQL